MSILTIAQAADLKVIHPTDLIKQFEGSLAGYNVEGVIPSSLGNYGVFPYATVLRGRLHYPLNNTDGCRPFTTDDFNGTHLADGKKHNHHPIIMVDRGTCRFTQKSKHIMDFGGLMAVIVDNKVDEDPEHLIMADDGTGSHVKIPSFLVGKDNGEILKKAIHEEEELEGEADSKK